MIGLLREFPDDDRALQRVLALGVATVADEAVAELLAKPHWIYGPL